MLCVFVVLILLSATGLLAASIGPLKGTPGAGPLRVVAIVQYVLAGILVGAALLGYA